MSVWHLGREKDLMRRRSLVYAGDNFHYVHPYKELPILDGNIPLSPLKAHQ